MPCLPPSSRGARRAPSAGSDASAVLAYALSTVVSAGTLAAASSAALALAPPASDASGTGTLAAPGAGVGIATASLAEKLGVTGALVGAADGLPPAGTGALEPPPPPPQAARTATAENGAARKDASHPPVIGRARSWGIPEFVKFTGACLAAIARGYTERTLVAWSTPFTRTRRSSRWARVASSRAAGTARSSLAASLTRL